MLRLSALSIGVGLAVLFVVGLSAHATVWLTWLNGVAAALAIGSIALVAAERATLGQGLLLGFTAAGLLALWVTALGTGATRWLTWCTFAAALATGLAAFGGTLQGLLERPPRRSDHLA